MSDHPNLASLKGRWDNFFERKHEITQYVEQLYGDACTLIRQRDERDTGIAALRAELAEAKADHKECRDELHQASLLLVDGQRRSRAELAKSESMGDALEKSGKSLCAEIVKLRADLAKQEAVADAAREKCNRILDIMGANAYDMGCRNTARDILRALDGEP